MKEKVGRLIKNGLISLVSLLFTLAMLEGAVRICLPVTDWPVVEYEEVIGNHLAPNQTGTYVVGAFGQISGEYQINAAGWNSLHEYSTDKAEGALRIAVIGDSFVEALTVDVDQAFPAVLESALEASSVCANHEPIEVYSFGYSGSSLSQYLNMMRYAAERYSPDVYIILLYPFNDFDEVLVTDTPIHPHSLSFRQTADGGFQEVPPVPYSPSRFRRFLVNFALVRYLYGNLGLGETDLLHDLFRPQLEDTERILPDGESGTASSLSETAVMAELVTHIIREYQTVASDTDGALLLLMDAIRPAIYGDPPVDWLDPDYYQQVHGFVEQASEQAGVDFIDLTDPFTAHYQINGERFEPSLDYHWNAVGHQVVGETAAEWVIGNVCMQSDQ